MRIAGMILSVALLAGWPRPAIAQLPPDPPEAAAVASLVTLPTGDCNGADFYQKAEDAWRRDEMPRPAEETLRLPEGHAAFASMVRAAECQRFELPYSATIAIPPTDQPIPASRLYWGAARTMVDRAQALGNAGKRDEARQELGRVVVLGLQLYQDPGLTYIQQVVALRTIAMGVQGLGDLAIASGQEETAARCARVLARSRAYLDGLTRFLGQELPLRQLPAGPGLQAQVKKLSGYYDATTNKPVRSEMLLFLATVHAVAADEPVRQAASDILTRATRDADERLGQIARWGLALDKATAERILREMHVSL